MSDPIYESVRRVFTAVAKNLDDENGADPDVVEEAVARYGEALADMVYGWLVAVTGDLYEGEDEDEDNPGEVVHAEVVDAEYES